jgi:8-amino-7-oxononanoate synthase
MSEDALDPAARARWIDRVLGRKGGDEAAAPAPAVEIPEAHRRFDRHPAYERMQVTRTVADRLGLENPYFRLHEGVGGATTVVDGRELLNFSSYNYLGLNGHPEVSRAAVEAIERYGTSASSSRYVAGERPVQRELEAQLAQLHGVDDCLVFVSGHATNVSTIGTLFGPRDLVLHDGLIHNSVLEGIVRAGSARRAFAHNDAAALEALLQEMRGRFERVLIVVEGLYSMDGDLPDLPALIELKRRYGAFLMVDEAHSLGVVGDGGGGVRERSGVDGRSVDIWMGTLSKTLAGCGGYIAGDAALIELLRYNAPGFVYSVGIAPPLAAASLAALRLMQAQPQRVTRLRERSRHFLALLRERGVDTGLSQGYAIVPAIVGSSLAAVRASNALFEAGINVQPVTYPAVAEQTARLRFFLSCEHEDEALLRAADALSTVLNSTRGA